jgi:hypothetical protein
MKKDPRIGTNGWEQVLQSFAITFISGESDYAEMAMGDTPSSSSSLLPVI